MPFEVDYPLAYFTIKTMQKPSNIKLKYLLVLSLLAPCIELDISVPSLPYIANYFGISAGMAQMTIVYNFYGLVIACLLQGPLSDRFGRRNIMLIGNGIMTLGAIGCVTSQTIELLYASRLIQGIGASASMVLTTTIISDRFESKEAAGLYGVLASVLTIAMSSAPIVGGFINEAVGWRGNYFVVAIASAISLLMLFLYLPETLKMKKKLNISQVFKNYASIYTDLRFLSAALIPSLNYAGYLSFITVASFLYMDTYKLHITHYALHQAAIILSFSIVSMNTKQIILKLGELQTVYLGVGLCLLGGSLIIALSSITELFSPYLTTISMVIFATGCALSRNVPLAKAMETHPNIKGTTSSAFITLRMGIVSIFTSIVSMLYSGKLFLIGCILFTCAIGMILLAFYMKNNFKFMTKS